MATLTQPENTGTLDREAVQAAAREAAANDHRDVDVEELARHAAELRAWLDAHGTDTEPARTVDLRDPSEFPTGLPAILLHQHVWLPDGERYEPTPQTELDELIDRAFVVAEDSEPVTTPEHFVALPVQDDDARDHGDRAKARSRTLGWAAIVGIWAAAAALLVPLAIWGLVGAIDMTVDLSGDDAAEQVATGGDVPADLPAEGSELAAD